MLKLHQISPVSWRFENLTRCIRSNGFSQLIYLLSVCGEWGLWSVTRLYRIDFRFFQGDRWDAENENLWDIVPSALWTICRKQASSPEPKVGNNLFLNVTRLFAVGLFAVVNFTVGGSSRCFILSAKFLYGEVSARWTVLRRKVWSRITAKSPTSKKPWTVFTLLLLSNLTLCPVFCFFIGIYVFWVRQGFVKPNLEIDVNWHILRANVD